MQERLFKRVHVMGLDFYVDYFISGEIICIKEVHSGKIFKTDNIFIGKEPVIDVFRRESGIPEPVIVKENKVSEEKDGKKAKRKPASK